MDSQESADIADKTELTAVMGYQDSVDIAEVKVYQALADSQEWKVLVVTLEVGYQDTADSREYQVIAEYKESVGIADKTV